MKECKHIQEMLPALLEGVLSPDETGIIEEHLQTCGTCSKALEDLKKVVQLVRGLEEVEPPAWFTTRVMGKVREEAEQKKSGILGKLFYPLHVKVPLQAVASVLIVILVFYVYRSVEPEMKQDIKIAQAPSQTARREQPVQKDQLRQKIDRQDEDILSPEKQYEPKEETERPSGTLAESAPPRKQNKEEVPPAASFASKPANSATFLSESKEAPRLQNAPSPGLSQGEAGSAAPSAAGAKMEDTGGGAQQRDTLKAREFKAKKAELPSLTLRVNDVAFAVGEIKNRLGQLGASNIAAQSRDGVTIITAELAAQQLEELSKKLGDIGQLEKGSPPAATEGIISIRIEVTVKP